MKRVCVFCGSSAGAKPEYAQAAHQMGAALAQSGLGIVYGGGRVGLMGIVADATLAHGGEVIGVIPKPLFTKELAHAGLSDLRVVETMHERKALMAELADAFVAMPGGFGTLEEFCEVLTWAQLGLHSKPCALLNVANYFDPLLSLFDHAVSAGFVSAEQRAMVLEQKTPLDMLAVLKNYKAPRIVRWIDREST